MGRIGRSTLAGKQPVNQEGMGLEEMEPNTSVFFAQVRKADASHRMDITNQLLRGKHFNGPSKVVYLGDIAFAFLSQLPHPETPTMIEPPGFNEQQWSMQTSSGDIKLTVESRPYWAFGLLNSGYLNINRITGPMEGRARLVLDTVAALGQPPWEFSHQGSARKWLLKHHPHHTIKTNEQTWKDHCATGRETLREMIEVIVQRRDTLLRSMEDSEETTSLMASIGQEISTAREALSEDNGPAIERAMARAEAWIIGGDPWLQSEKHDLSDALNGVQDRRSLNSFGASVISMNGERLEGGSSIPFVDLTEDSSESE